jgi:hypothetical protein
MEIIVDNVYTFKLCSGEELIAKVKNLTPTHIDLEEPVSVAPGPQGIGLIPSLFTGENRSLVRLNTNSIALYAQTEENVKLKYVEALTGLKVPSKKLVLG